MMNVLKSPFVSDLKENKRGSSIFHSIYRRIRHKKSPPIILVSLLLMLGLLTPFLRFRRKKPNNNKCPGGYSLNNYTSQAQADFRKYRFPSVEERIRLYMSNWYTPPCQNYNDGFIPFTYHYNQTDIRQFHISVQELPKDGQERRWFDITDSIQPAIVFFANRNRIQACCNEADATSRMRHYCNDVNNTLLPAIDALDWTEPAPPILLQFGDAMESKAPGPSNGVLLSQPRIPHIKKFRMALSKAELERITAKDCYLGSRDVPMTIRKVDRLQPIVWKLNTRRHYGNLPQVSCWDNPWSSKVNMAVFRGKLSGGKIRESISDHAKCLKMARCRMVYSHINSTLVDARLTSTADKLPSIINGVNMTGAPISMSNLLKYKGLIMLEGNDVSSGLKWALLSQSVVLMQPPTFTSWLMEELLKPWVHYIPLNEDLTDVEDKMKWVMEHDAEAQRISHRATLWMRDLVFHPDVESDDRLIFRGILQRYNALFANRPDLANAL